MTSNAIRKQREKSAQRVIGKPFEKGNPGGALRKGVPNKTTRLVRDNIIDVFEKLGGVEGMHKWAAKSDYNRAQFYQLYAKLLPLDVQHTGELNVSGAVFLMPRPGQTYDPELFNGIDHERVEKKA